MAAGEVASHMRVAASTTSDYLEQIDVKSPPRFICMFHPNSSEPHLPIAINCKFFIK